MALKTIIRLNIYLILTLMIPFGVIPANGAQANQKNIISDLLVVKATGTSTIYLPIVRKSLPPVAMIYIPAGEFKMGCDPMHSGGYTCFAWSLPLHAVLLDSFKIDKTEVTNGYYAECVSAGACSPPWVSSSFTHPSYFNNPAYIDYPVVYVGWNDAYDYCSWVGKRLPTEAEWEKAAHGTNSLSYPWGDASPNCTMANYAPNGYSTCVGDTTPVGSYPGDASPYGVLDMAGNVFEWVNDWYKSDYYSVSPYYNPPGPPRQYETGAGHVVRGGGFDNGFVQMRTSNRGAGAPLTELWYNQGFRCASSP